MSGHHGAHPMEKPMTVTQRLLASISCAMLVTSAACGEPARTASGAGPLVLERTIPLAGVAGRIDHLAIDVAHGRLFIAELGNGTVEVVDVASGRSFRRISGLKEPQGLAYLPDLDELVVASGGDGSVRFYKGSDLAPAGVISLGDDADNVRIAPSSDRVVVGYGSGALAIIDPAGLKVIGRIALPGHPESFRLAGDRAFVNVPGAQRMVVAELSSGRTVASWHMPYLMNFPLALDRESGRVTVVFRLPARITSFDVTTGKTTADAATCGDSDDLFFDGRRQRFYVTCGSGNVDVVGVAPAGFGRVDHVATRAGARTSLFVPEQDRLYVAARARPGEKAAILVYRPQP